MDRTAPSPTLTDRIRVFLAADRFATIATIGPDGRPRQAVVWYTLDGDDLILNSREGRRWPDDLLRDPRISAAIAAAGDGYSWVGLSGVVEPIRDQVTAQADIAAMARRYHADEPAKAERLIRAFEAQTRISFRMRIDTVHDHIED